MVGNTCGKFGHLNSIVSTATQNSPFLPQWRFKPLSVLIAPIHEGAARLDGPERPDDYDYCGLEAEHMANPLKMRATKIVINRKKTKQKSESKYMSL